MKVIIISRPTNESPLRETWCTEKSHEVLAITPPIADWKLDSTLTISTTFGPDRTSRSFRCCCFRNARTISTNNGLFEQLQSGPPWYRNCPSQSHQWSPPLFFYRPPCPQGVPQGSMLDPLNLGVDWQLKPAKDKYPRKEHVGTLYTEKLCI